MFDVNCVEIGSYTYGTIQLLDYECKKTKLKVGSFCSIARDVVFMIGGEHHKNTFSTFPWDAFFVNNNKSREKNLSKGDIVVGNGVWIGYGATLLSGITIGDGCIVGAKSVVTKSFEPYSIVAGNPARCIRKRFSPKIIEELLTIDFDKIDDKIIDRLLKEDLLYQKLSLDILMNIKKIIEQNG